MGELPEANELQDAPELNGQSPCGPAEETGPVLRGSAEGGGVFLRVGVEVFLVLVATAVMWVLFRHLESGRRLSVEPGLLWRWAGLFGLGHVSAAVFREFPRSDELALLRLGMVAFCRTLLPLVVVAILEYKGRLDSGGGWAWVAAGYYFVPLVVSLAGKFPGRRQKPVSSLP